MAGSEHDPIRDFNEGSLRGHVKATCVLATLSAQKPKQASKFSLKQEGGCWMSHARMSRNARARRALFSSPQQIATSLRSPHDSDPAVSKLFRSVEPPAVSIPLTTTKGQSPTSTAAKTTRVLALVVRPASLFVVAPGRVWGVTCLVNVHTHFLSPLSHSTRFASTPLALSPSTPAPLALVDLSRSPLRPLCTLPEFIPSFSRRWPHLPDLQLLPAAVHLL